MTRKLLTISLLLFAFCSGKSYASHIVGGEVTYKFLGDSIGGPLLNRVTFFKYLVSVVIYEDCQNGQPEAIAEDNPAFLAVYPTDSKIAYNIDTSVYFTPPQIQVPANFNNSCVTHVPPLCLLKKTFNKIYALPHNSSGYVVAYERCCRNNAIVNIISPGDNGSTYYCTLPKYPTRNNSAVFKNYPPQIICLNNPLKYDHSATDADGDSLSYEFCSALLGASNAIKPIPGPPPYDSVKYINPFKSNSPMPGFPPIQIDARTGIITGTPNRIGRYLVTICCNEWRDGIIVNTIKREFQFVVTDCSKVVVADIPQFSDAPNTYIVNCADYSVHFVNNSKGGFQYLWNFGVAGTTKDTSTLFEPDFTYPDTGTYELKLVVNPASTCPDSITRLVKIYPKFKTAFDDSGAYCPESPIKFKDLSTSTLKPIVYWKWMFGDGDSSFEQNPIHQYPASGVYNTVLISQNYKFCADTAVRKIQVQSFQPFAGYDTIVVKGESINFNATGGINYLWMPESNLNKNTIADPTGYYPDTGTYTYFVNVISAYGCEGADTIQVKVVGQSAFYVPTAFSPNGDGKNDIFRPIAIGYRSLNHFRVFNRWGEKVYFGQSLDGGWDGNYKGKPAEMGAYYWELSYTDRYGKQGIMKGDVTLMR